MAANANASTSVKVNDPAPKVDPIKFGGRDQKVQTVDIRTVKRDPTLNIRWHAGSEVWGVKVEKDDLDIPGLMVEIVDGGGILEPLWLSQRDDGLYVLRGNRRSEAGQRLVDDPTCPPDVMKTLTERTPAFIFKGLTRDQEQDLVQDQTQKPFRRSEIVRHVFELRKMRRTFDQIVAHNWEKIGNAFSNPKKVSELRAVADPTARREKLRTWLRGTLDNYLLWGFDLGAWTQRQILLSEMKLDGLLPENAEGPWFDTTKSSQKRIGELKKAKEKDGSKFDSFAPLAVEGSEFAKLANAYHAEDYGTAGTAATTKGPKMKTRTELEAVRNSYQSSLAQEMLKYVLGEEAPNLTAADDAAAIAQSKLQLAMSYLPRLKPELATIVRLCIINPDPTDFQRYLEANTVDQEETPPEVEELKDDTVQAE